MNWIYYLLEANFYLCVFYTLYYFLLRGETYYQFNRAYLLCICLMAFIIPLLQIGILKTPPQPLQQVAAAGLVTSSPPLHAAAIAPAVTWTAESYCLAFYIAVAIVMAVLFLLKIFKLYLLVYNGKRMVNHDFRLVEIDDNNAFSFLGYLFIDPKLADAETIVQHEMVHIRQKHSLDILFLEFFKIINWFNPVVYLLQNNIKELHEFIADRETVKQQTDVGFYTDFLLHNAYDFSLTTLTNNFFNKNLLKRRIMMLHQKPSGSRARLKYLLVLPVCAGLLCISTLAFSKTYGWLDLAPRHELATTKLVKADVAVIATKTTVNGTEKANHHQEKYMDSTDQITPKGYHYRETSIVHNGRTDFEVNIIPNEKNVDALKILKSRATPKIIKMLQDKYGYTFPSKIPPPPPPMPPAPKSPHGPNAANLNRFPPPAVATVDIATPTAAPKSLATPPPPIAPFKPLANGFSALDKYMGKYVRFPKAAADKKLAGSVILSFNVGTDQKVSGITLIRGIGSGCDEEAARALKSFDGTLDVKPGTYKMAVTFTINGSEAPKPASESLSSDPFFAGEVVLVFYPNN